MRLLHIPPSSPLFIILPVSYGTTAGIGTQAIWGSIITFPSCFKYSSIGYQHVPSITFIHFAVDNTYSQYGGRRRPLPNNGANLRHTHFIIDSFFPCLAILSSILLLVPYSWWLGGTTAIWW